MANHVALPLIALRDGRVIAPPEASIFFVGRPASVAALRAAEAEAGDLVLASLRDPDGEMLAPENVFNVGVKAPIIRVSEWPEGAMEVFVEAEQRVRLRIFSLQRDGFYRVAVEPWNDAPSDEAEVRRLGRIAFERFAALARRAGLPAEINKMLWHGAREDHPQGFQSLPWVALRYLAYGQERHWMPLEQRQQLLEAPSLSERLQLLIKLLDEAHPPPSLASDLTPFLMRAVTYHLA